MSLAALAIAFLPSPSLWAFESPELSRRFARIAQVSNQARAACERFERDWQALENADLPPRARVRQLIALVESYPGGDPVLKEAESAFEEAAVSRSWFNPMPIYDCKPLALFQAYKALLVAEHRARLSVSDRRRVAGAFFKRASEELERFPTIMGLLAWNELARMWVAEKWLSVSDPMFLALARLEAEARSLETEIRQRTHMPDYPALGNWNWDRLTPPQKKAAMDEIHFEVLRTQALAHETERVFERLE
jgi:hypothetical protein